VKLVPGATSSYGNNPTPADFGPRGEGYGDDCSAWMQYTETYTLDTYTYL
jgi:hypothetical protein